MPFGMFACFTSKRHSWPQPHVRVVGYAQRPPYSLVFPLGTLYPLRGFSACGVGRAQCCEYVNNVTILNASGTLVQQIFNTSFYGTIPTTRLPAETLPQTPHPSSAPSFSALQRRLLYGKSHSFFTQNCIRLAVSSVWALRQKI